MLSHVQWRTMNSDEDRSGDADDNPADAVDASAAETTEVDTGDGATEEAQSVEAAAVGPESEGPESARHWSVSLALAAAVAALVAAVVCLGYFGYTGVRAYTVDSEREQVRNSAIDGAEQAILNTMTIDPADLDGWKKRINSSLTGDALKQATDESANGVLQQIAAAEDRAAKLSVRIVRSAATEVNPDENTAKVLVLSEASSSSAPDQASGQSYLVTMTEDGDAWKASVIVPLTGIQYDANSAKSAGEAPNGEAPNGGAPNGNEQGSGN